MWYSRDMGDGNVLLQKWHEAFHPQPRDDDCEGDRIPEVGLEPKLDGEVLAESREPADPMDFMLKSSSPFSVYFCPSSLLSGLSTLWFTMSLRGDVKSGLWLLCSPLFNPGITETSPMDFGGVGKPFMKGGN